MRITSAFFCFLFFLASCGGQKGRLRIRGAFDNLPQADLLLFSPDGGLSVAVDTLHIVKGRFDYQTPLEGADPYTFVIVYPNFSTLSFQAHAGSDIRIKGDAFSLSQVKVEGADSLLPQEVATPKSPLSIGKKLPRSPLIRHPRGTYLLLAFWAEWKYGSSSVNYNIRQALREHPDSLSAFTYSLDVDPTTPRSDQSVEDTARWHTLCDYRGWGSPLVAKYGVRNLPQLVLVSPRGIVVALGSDYNRDIKPALQKIGDSNF